MMPSGATRVTASVVLLWMRTDVPRDQAMDYWRGPHSQLVARTPGFREYRQHHFPAEPVGLWPATDGVETLIPPDRRIDGVPEVTLDGVLGAARSLRPNRAVVEDEVNVFARTVLHSTSLGGGRWFPVAQPGRTGARTVVLLRRRPTAAAGTLTGLVHDRIGPALADLPGVTEVRSLRFSPFKASAWNTPGVAHDYPEDDQFHGCLVLGARDQTALAKALAREELAALSAEVSASCSAIHAYPVDATYVYTRDGRPTLPQVTPEPKPSLEPVKRTVATAPPVPEATRAFPPATLVALPGHGAEDIVAGTDGYLYCGLESGAIARLDPASDAIDVVADTGGRPLGLEALPDGRLVVCDTRRGLLRVDPAIGTVETLTQYVDDVPLRFCSNAAATPDGAIWFTESTSRFDFEHFMGSFYEHRPSGRLMRRDADGTVEVVLSDLYFANGLTLTPDGSALVLAETAGYRLSRIDLDGPRAGHRQDLVDNLPGFADNISAFVNGRAWVAITGPRSTALDRLATAPSALRKLIWRLPEQAGPESVWCRAITADGACVEDIRGHHHEFHAVTGVVQHDQHLYLASATHASLLRLDLEDAQ